MRSLVTLRGGGREGHQRLRDGTDARRATTHVTADWVASTRRTMRVQLTALVTGLDVDLGPEESKRLSARTQRGSHWGKGELQVAKARDLDVKGRLDKVDGRDGAVRDDTGAVPGPGEVKEFSNPAPQPVDWLLHDAHLVQ